MIKTTWTLEGGQQATCEGNDQLVNWPEAADAVTRVEVDINACGRLRLVASATACGKIVLSQMGCDLVLEAGGSAGEFVVTVSEGAIRVPILLLAVLQNRADRELPAEIESKFSNLQGQIDALRQRVQGGQA